DRETGFVSVGFWIEGRASIAAVGPAGQIDQLHVGKSFRQELHNGGELGLQSLGVLGEALRRPGVRLLDPYGLDLLAGGCRRLEPLVNRGPVFGAAAVVVRVLDAESRHAA